MVSLVLGLSVSGAQANELYLIDAHSQIDHFVDRSTIVPLMDKAGIRHVILSTRGRVAPEQITGFAAKHPDRVTASVRTKSKHYASNSPKFYKKFEKQMRMPGFGAMAELILWHAKKGNKAPEWVVPPDAKQVRVALKGALAKGWPFIIHIEFNSLSRTDYKTYMDGLGRLLIANPDHPFVLIHMAQIEAGPAGKLLAVHSNLHFMTSHASPSYQRGGKPFINMFEGDSLKPEWKALVAKYPDRFVFALDNVFSFFWTPDRYLSKMRLWWKAVTELPPEQAHLLAHGNAERLWRLAPKPSAVTVFTPDQAKKHLGAIKGSTSTARRFRRRR